MGLKQFTLEKKREALQLVEKMLDEPLTPQEVINSHSRNNIEYLRARCRSQLHSIIGILQFLKDQTDPLSSAIEREIRLAQKTFHAGHNNEPHERIEVCGHTVKAVVSNIRRNDVDWSEYSLVLEGMGREGDIVLLEVLDPSGSTKKVEDYYGRDQALARGDKILAVLGHRHSGTSEYGGIPEEGWDITRSPEIDLLCHGGIVGRVQSIPSRMGKHPTQLQIHGILSLHGKSLNLKDLFPPWENTLKPSAPIIANCGTGAEVGKTTAAASLIKELKSRGLRVAATKLAGTGRYRDLLGLRDAGADIFLDFPDVGLPSTYTSSERYLPAIKTLINKLNQDKPDIIVAEFGGDIIEANIPNFFGDSQLRPLVRAVVHSASDIMGMRGSLDYFDKWQMGNLPKFVTYPIGRNQKGSQARIEDHVGIPVFDPLDEDASREVITSILSSLQSEEAIVTK